MSKTMISRNTLKRFNSALHAILNEGLDPVRCSIETRNRVLGPNWSQHDFLQWLEYDTFVIDHHLNIVGVADEFSGFFRGTFTQCTRVLQRAVLRQMSLDDSAAIERAAEKGEPAHV